MCPLKEKGYTVELFNPETKKWQRADNLCISCVNKCKRKFVPVCYDYRQVKYIFSELSNCQEMHQIENFLLKGHKLPKRMKSVVFDEDAEIKAVIRADAEKTADDIWNTNDVYCYYGNLEE